MYEKSSEEWDYISRTSPDECLKALEKLKLCLSTTHLNGSKAKECIIQGKVRSFEPPELDLKEVVTNKEVQ